MISISRALGGVVAAAGLAGLAWIANAPMAVHPSDAAQLRLAWSALPERIEVCRQLTDEELANVPAHMRQPVACEGTTAEYRLQVRRDGALLVDRVVHGGGMRRDRRLYVFDEVTVPEGEWAIDVRFERVTAGEPHIPPAVSDGTATRPRADTVPARLQLARRVRLSPREVLLVTFDAASRELVAIQSERR